MEIDKLYIENNLLNKRGHLKNALLKKINKSPQELYDILNPSAPKKCEGGKSTSFLSFSKGYSKYCKDKNCICNINKKKEKYKKQALSLSKTRQKETKEQKEKRIINFKKTMENKTTEEKELISKSRKESFIKRSKEEKEKTKKKINETWSSKTKEELNTINQRRKQTKLEKYNNENFNNPSKNLETRKKHNLENFYSKGLMHIKNVEEYNEEGIRKFIVDGVFKKDACKEYFNIGNSKIYKLKNILDIKEPTLYKREGVEFKINKMFDYVFEVNNRRIIKPLELDLYSKNHNFAIEYNGVMFHSHGISKYSVFNNPIEEPKRHLYKTEQCEERNIQLFHIFDTEWLSDKREIWISMIENKLNKNIKIGARKCIVKEVSTKEAKEFINSNHLQGYINAKIKIGLYYEGKLLQVMTFGKPRYNKEYQYELIRFCTLKGYSVQGGGSKLLKTFERLYEPESLISYANRRWSTGKFYEKSGFQFIKNTPPNYFFFNPKDCVLRSRIQFQKHKLKNILESYDEKLTAKENIYMNNFRKIYDCGNKVYCKKYL